MTRELLGRAIGIAKDTAAVVSNIRNSANEPQYSYLWEVTLPNLDNVTIPRVESTNLPTPAVSSDSFYNKGMTIPLPGSKSLPSFQIKLYNDSSNAAIKYCDEWIRLVFRNDGTYGYPDDYAKLVTVHLTDKLRRRRLTRKFLVYMDTYSASELSKETGRVIVTANLQVMLVSDPTTDNDESSESFLDVARGAVQNFSLF